jgi:hypothetical protein
MTDEQAYQLVTRFYEAGKSGQPMPQAEKAHLPGARLAYEAGRRHNQPIDPTETPLMAKLVLESREARA